MIALRIKITEGEQAVRMWGKKVVQRSPDALGNHAALAVIYILLDREEEARAAANKVLETDPNFSVERASKAWPYKNQADLKLVVDAMHKAGLK